MLIPYVCIVDNLVDPRFLLKYSTGLQSLFLDSKSVREDLYKYVPRADLVKLEKWKR